MKRRRDDADINWYEDDDFSYEEVPVRRRHREEPVQRYEDYGRRSEPELYRTESRSRRSEPELYRAESRSRRSEPDLYRAESRSRRSEPDLYRAEPRRRESESEVSRGGSDLRRQERSAYREELRRRRSESSADREDPRGRRAEAAPRREDPRRRRPEGTPRREDSRRRRPEGTPRREDSRRRRPEEYSSREYEEARRRRAAAGHWEEEERYEKETGRGGKKRGGCCLGGCLIPLLLAVIVLGGLAYMAVGIIWGRVKNPGFSPAEVSSNPDLTYGDSEVYRNYDLIMLYGVDSRDQDPLKTGALADSNILVAINRKTGEITLTSIYRDTCVETTQGDYMKLTEVYSSYGPKESLQTINRNLDLRVNQFVTVTWASVARAINSLGGVDISVTAAEARGINKYIDEVIKNTGIRSNYVPENLSESGEKIHLDGVQAVTFCRLRKGLGDDYKRTERQRVVIAAAFAKAKQNPLKAGITAYRVLPQIASNISTGELMKLITGALNYDMGDSYGFPQELRDDTAFVVPTTLESNDIWLHETVFRNRSYTPSDTVERISDAMKSK